MATTATPRRRTRKPKAEIRSHVPTVRKAAEKPMVVCLCGSTKFPSVFQEAMKRETFMGRIVLTVGTFAHFDKDVTEGVKRMLDELHLRKIDLADEILVVNPDGYIDASAKNQIEYAKAKGKRVRYWVVKV